MIDTEKKPTQAGSLNTYKGLEPEPQLLTGVTRISTENVSTYPLGGRNEDGSNRTAATAVDSLIDQGKLANPQSDTAVSPDFSQKAQELIGKNNPPIKDELPST